MSFDGQYKRRPVVSLGGTSKRQEKASTLIQRVQEERQRREATRKKNASALQIQSFVRGAVVRHKQYAIQRAAFDEARLLLQSTKDQEPDVTSVTLLIRRLLFFYSVSEDTPRLIWLCQLLLKYRSITRKLHGQEMLRWLYQLKHLLLLCCRSLDVALEGSSPVAVQMRMLEVFTSHEGYTVDPKESPSGDSKRCAMSVMIFLIRNGYFQYLRALVNLKIPASLEHSPVPPTPLAGAIRDLVVRPVNMVCQHYGVGSAGFEMSDERHETLATVTSELLCKQMPEQITCFLLPALAHPDTRFPFGLLVETLLQGHSGGPYQVNPTPWLLYAVMVFADSLIDSLTDAQLISYIRVLHFLLPQLPGRGHKYADGVESDESDSDEESSVQQDLLSLRERCISVLDSRKHVKRLEALVLGTMDSQSARMEWHGSKKVMSSLCFLCHFLMSECKLPVPRTRLLFTLALNRAFIRHLWEHTKSVSTTTTLGKEIPLLQVVSQGIGLSTAEAEQIVHVLALFCSLLNYTLFSIHDAEFYGEGGQAHSMPFNVHEFVTISSILRDVAIGVTGIIYPDSQPHLNEHYSAAMKSVGARSAAMETTTYYPQHAWIKLLENITSLVKQLHQRDARRPFCSEGHWLSHKVCIDPLQVRIDGFFPSDDAQSAEEGTVHTGMSYTTARHMSILQHIPFVVPFKDRVKLLQRILSRDRQESQGDLHQFMMGPAIDISINRNHIYQNAFDQLAQGKAPNLKQRVRVRIINFQGLEEAGVDGGGLFREFLNELLKAGFDANIGFFKYSNEGLLYPNPQVSILTPDYLKHYHFLGRMLGKALYENMLVELPFASFFLCKLLSKFSTDLDIHHLESLDPEMYRNLLFLKSYDGNVEDLALNFTIVNNDLGENQVVELKPGGRDIPVTNSNRISYIHLVADYRLNRQIRPHCQAFRAGLSDVIDLDWLRMFDHNELQVLISGAPVPVDIEDLKRNTNYSGGFSVDHPCIQAFWAAVSSFSDKQKRLLLKFVTSCSRPPLLGFKELYPPFCVHSAGRENRLPSASTCMNLLKLPEFDDEQTMKERLLYAVESEAGFELS